jgi:hypothetical protein
VHEDPTPLADRQPGYYLNEDGLWVEAWGATDPDGTFRWAPAAIDRTRLRLDWTRGDLHRFEPLTSTPELASYLAACIAAEARSSA